MKQTKAQRLAYALRNWPDIRIDFNAAADLLRRQDDLLRQAEKALKTVAKELGIDWLRDEFFDANETMLAIRAHREAK